MPKIERLSPTKPSELKEAIGKLDPADPKPLVTHPDDGFLGFMEAMFPDISRDRVYAQKFLREPTGRGPHWDVYNSLIDTAHPAIGVYNLTGHASLRAFVLGRKLQEYYDETYPEPTDAAFEARREIASLAIALKEGGLTIMEAKITPATGMVFPQFRRGRHLVHDVVPTEAKTIGEFLSIFPPIDLSESGSFVKLVVPRDEATAAANFVTRGYVPFSQFIEEQLAGVSYEESNVKTTPDKPVVSAPVRLRRRKPVAVPDFFRGERGEPARKPPCNLD